MNFWQSIENRRKKLAGLSRAEMARRAGISESTVTKGLDRNTRPISAVRKAVEGVISAEEEVQGVPGEAA